jgi:hypothetical protein
MEIRGAKIRPAVPEKIRPTVYIGLYYYTKAQLMFDCIEFACYLHVCGVRVSAGKTVTLVSTPPTCMLQHQSSCL